VLLCCVAGRAVMPIAAEIRGCSSARHICGAPEHKTRNASRHMAQRGWSRAVGGDYAKRQVADAMRKVRRAKGHLR